MKKIIAAFLLLGIVPAQDFLDITKNKDSELIGGVIKTNTRIVVIGHINDFSLDNGYPTKKKTAYGNVVMQNGKLNDFILDRGYPYKKTVQTNLSGFKVIRRY